jgi:hypothetical protein
MDRGIKRSFPTPPTLLVDVTLAPIKTGTVSNAGRGADSPYRCWRRQFDGSNHRRYELRPTGIHRWSEAVPLRFKRSGWNDAVIWRK